MKVEFHVTTWNPRVEMPSVWTVYGDPLPNLFLMRVEAKMCRCALQVFLDWASHLRALSLVGVRLWFPLTNYWPESSPNLTHSPPSVLVHSPSFSSQLKPTHLHLLSLHPSSFAPLTRLILPALPFDRNVQTSKRCRHSFCLHVHVKTTITRRLALRNPPHPWRLPESIP